MPRILTSTLDAQVTEVRYLPAADQIIVFYHEVTTGPDGNIDQSPARQLTISTELTAAQKTTLRNIFTALIGVFKNTHYS